MKSKAILIICALLSIIISNSGDASIWGEFPSNETRIDKYSWFSSQRCLNGKDTYELNDELLREIQTAVYSSYKEKFPEREIINCSQETIKNELYHLCLIEKIDDDTSIQISIYSPRLINLQIRYTGDLSVEKISEFEKILMDKGKDVEEIIVNTISTLNCKEVTGDYFDVPETTGETLFELESSYKSRIPESNKGTTVFFNIAYLFFYTNQSNFQRILIDKDRLLELDRVEYVDINNTLLPFPFTEYLGGDTPGTRQFMIDVEVPTIKVKRIKTFDSFYIFNINSTFYGAIFKGYVDVIGSLISHSLKIKNYRGDVLNEIKRVKEVRKEFSEKKEVEITENYKNLQGAINNYVGYTEYLLPLKMHNALTSSYVKNKQLLYTLRVPSDLLNRSRHDPYIRNFESYEEVEFLSDFFTNFDRVSSSAEAVIIEFESELNLLYTEIKFYENSINLRSQEQTINKIDEQIGQVDRLAKISEEQSQKIGELLIGIGSVENITKEQSDTASLNTKIASYSLGVSAFLLLATIVLVILTIQMLYSDWLRNLRRREEICLGILRELRENVELVESGNIIFLRDDAGKIMKNSGIANIFKSKTYEKIVEVYWKIYIINDKIRVRELFLLFEQLKDKKKKFEWEFTKLSFKSLRREIGEIIPLVEEEMERITSQKSFIKFLKFK